MSTAERRRVVDNSPPAPGDVELVRSFLSLHDHEGDDERSLPPSHRSLREFFVERGLLRLDDPAGPDELETAFVLHRSLHRKVPDNADAPFSSEDAAVIEESARAARLELRFEPDGPPRIEPMATGVPGALGRILAVAFLAQLDGSWAHLKRCADETCTSVFYDRSKNQSGKWCSMQSCGNRNKVRAWRARQSTRGSTA